jgi:hypothetical protein
MDDNDWRLQGQERYLTGAALGRRRWQPMRPGWDHDHCEFCWTKFGAAEVPNAVHESWSTGWISLGLRSVFCRFSR